MTVIQIDTSQQYSTTVTWPNSIARLATPTLTLRILGSSCGLYVLQFPLLSAMESQ